MERGTLCWHLANTAAGAPPEDQLTFIDGKEREQRLHWSEVYRRARCAAGKLGTAGVRRGDFVAIILPTELAFIDALFGCQLLGAVPVPLYPPVRLGRLEEYYERTAAMLQAVNARAIVTSGRVKRVLGKVVERYQPRLGLIDASTLASGEEYEPQTVRPDDLAMVQFSSGTTVAPKPVALTHRQVLANVEAILDFIPTDVGFKQSGVSWLPLYHDMGLIGCVFVALVGPGPLALIPPEQFLAKPELWLRAISRHKATVSPAPNFAFSLCAERIDDAALAGVDLNSWRLALTGAEPVAVSSLRAFNQRFSPFGLRPEALTPVYGLAEAALAVTFSDPGQPFPTQHFDRVALASGLAKTTQPGDESLEMVSVGVPIRGFQVAIRDESNLDKPPNHVGKIWAYGPSVMRGYLNREEQPICEGWLDTGDVGFLHDNQLFITGRLKDVVILRGQNHDPHDIEQALDHVDGVRTGCAAAVSDLAQDGEQLLVFVEVRELTNDLAERCQRAVRSRTGLTPDLIVLLAAGTLPRTSSGKIRRSETLNQWKNGQLQPPERVTPWLLAGVMASSALAFWRSRNSSET